MSVGFRNITKARLKEAISAGDTTIRLENPADYPAFLKSPGTYVYANLISHQYSEIVKIDVAASTVNGLSVARGQESTVARAWGRGTWLYQDVSAAALGDFQQKGTFRTVEYNPNGVLTPAYAGEKIYQDDLTDCKKRWWKSFNATDPYWTLIVGTICEGETLSYPDDFEWPVIFALWVSHFDNTKWQLWNINPKGIWDGSKWNSENNSGYEYIFIEPIGSWATGFRPTICRVTHTQAGDPSTFADLAIADVDYATDGFNNYVSMTEASIYVNMTKDIFLLQLSRPSGGAAYSITNIEFLSEW